MKTKADESPTLRRNEWKWQLFNDTCIQA